MLQTLMLALLMLVDSESRAHADALLATGAAGKSRGAARPGRFARYLTPAPASALDAQRDAAHAAASPGAKWFHGRQTTLVIAASCAAVMLAIVLLIVFA
jgi:hypothetical protein